MNEAVTSPSAEELSLLRRQDHAAFARLLASNENLIAGMCQAMGLRGHDLEDATAEAFAEIYRSLPSYEGRAALSTWTYRIACRVVWRIRKQRSLRRTEPVDATPVVSDAPAPPQRFDQQARSQRIWQAIGQLEPRQAVAVELHYRRGCTIEEIAEKLACPPGTVKTLLHRARAVLRQTLRGELDS